MDGERWEKVSEGDIVSFVQSQGQIADSSRLAKSIVDGPSDELCQDKEAKEYPCKEGTETAYSCSKALLLTMILELNTLA